MNEVKMKSNLDNQKLSTHQQQISKAVDVNSDAEESDQDHFAHGSGSAGFKDIGDVTHDDIQLLTEVQEKERINNLLNMVHDQSVRNQQIYLQDVQTMDQSQVPQEFKYTNILSSPKSRVASKIMSDRKSPTVSSIQSKSDQQRTREDQSENSTSHTSQKEKRSEDRKPRKKGGNKIADNGYVPLKLYHQKEKHNNKQNQSSEDKGGNNQYDDNKSIGKQDSGTTLPNINANRNEIENSKVVPSPSSPSFKDHMNFLQNSSRDLVGQERNANKPNMNEWPLVINITYTQYEVLEDCAQETNFRLSTDEDQVQEDWDIWWIDGPILPTLLLKMKPYQRTNHIPAVYVIARKNLLARNLINMAQVLPDYFNFFPDTWILPADSKSFKEQFNNKRAKTFIIKPESQCQGKGIFLTRNCDWVVQGEHYVAQRYLHKPYLIDDLKFDLRIYVLITGVNPLRCFIYKEGLARFATETYHSPMGSNLNNLCMHLTNYAINKEADGFIQNDDAKHDDIGHKRSLTSILQHIDKHRKPGELTSDQIWSDIKQVCVKTILSGIHPIAHLYKSAKPQDVENSLCFQIMGFDIFLDNNCKSYLIEVNQSPSFMCDSPLDYSIKKNIIRDTLHILNLSWKRKNKYLTNMKNEMANRLVGKQRVTQADREQIREKKTRIKDKFENNNLVENDYLMDVYEQIIEKARQVYEDSTAGKNSYHRNKKENQQEAVQITEKKIFDPTPQRPDTNKTRKPSQFDVNGAPTIIQSKQPKFKAGLPPASKKNSSLNTTVLVGKSEQNFQTTHKQQREFDKRMSQKGGNQLNYPEQLSEKGNSSQMGMTSQQTQNYYPGQTTQADSIFTRPDGQQQSLQPAVQMRVQQPPMNQTQQQQQKQVYLHQEQQQTQFERKDNSVYKTPVQQFAFAQQDLMKQLEQNFKQDKYYMEGMQIKTQHLNPQQQQFKQKGETPFRLKHPQGKMIPVVTMDSQPATGSSNIFTTSEQMQAELAFVQHQDHKANSDYKHLRRSNYSQSQGNKNDFTMGQKIDQLNGGAATKAIELKQQQPSSRTIDRAHGQQYLHYPYQQHQYAEAKKLVSGPQQVTPMNFDIQNPKLREGLPPSNLFASQSKQQFVQKQNHQQIAANNLHQIMNETSITQSSNGKKQYVLTPNQHQQLSSQHFGQSKKPETNRTLQDDFLGNPTVFDYIQQNLNNRSQQPQMLINNQKGLSDSFDQLGQNNLRQRVQKQQQQATLGYADSVRQGDVAVVGFKYQSPQSLTSTGLNAQSSALIQKLGIPITDNNKNKQVYTKNFNNQQAHLGQQSQVLLSAIPRQVKQHNSSSRCSQNQFDTNASMKSISKVQNPITTIAAVQGYPPVANSNSTTIGNPPGNQSSKSKQSHRDSEQYNAFQQHFQHINDVGNQRQIQQKPKYHQGGGSNSKSISQKGGIMQIMHVQNLHNLQNQVNQINPPAPRTHQMGPSAKFHQQSPIKTSMTAVGANAMMAGAAHAGMMAMPGQSSRISNHGGSKSTQPGGITSSLAENGHGIMHNNQIPLRENLSKSNALPSQLFSPNSKDLQNQQPLLSGALGQRSGTGNKTQSTAPSFHNILTEPDTHGLLNNVTNQPQLVLRSQQARPHQTQQ